MKDRDYLINMYNATSTDDGTGEIETYEAWLERQLIARIERWEENEKEKKLDQCSHESTIFKSVRCNCCATCGEIIETDI
jgi:hypothetical protein